MSTSTPRYYDNGIFHLSQKQPRVSLQSSGLAGGDPVAHSLLKYALTFVLGFAAGRLYDRLM